MAEKPEFSFSRTFPQTIWKMVAVPGKPVLVLELREEAKRDLRFSALNYESNQFLWEGVQLSESWWVSLFDADEKKVYCRKFQNTVNPDEVAWMAIEIATGKEYSGEEAKMPSSFQNLSDVRVPVQYLHDQPYFGSVKQFLNAKLNVDAVKAMEYLEYEKYIFVSYYISSGTRFENYLVVFDDAGELRLREKLNGSLTGLGLGTFFLRGRYLFFVRDKRELVVYLI